MFFTISVIIVFTFTSFSGFEAFVFSVNVLPTSKSFHFPEHFERNSRTRLISAPPATSLRNLSYAHQRCVRWDQQRLHLSWSLAVREQCPRKCSTCLWKSSRDHLHTEPSTLSFCASGHSCADVRSWETSATGERFTCAYVTPAC